MAPVIIILDPLHPPLHLPLCLSPQQWPHVIPQHVENTMRMRRTSAEATSHTFPFFILCFLFGENQLGHITDSCSLLLRAVVVEGEGRCRSEKLGDLIPRYHRGHLDTLSQSLFCMVSKMDTQMLKSFFSSFVLFIYTSVSVIIILLHLVGD